MVHLYGKWDSKVLPYALMLWDSKVLPEIVATIEW